MCVTVFESSFGGRVGRVRGGLLWTCKEQHEYRWVLPVFQPAKTRSASKSQPEASEYFCTRTKDAWAGFVTQSLSPHNSLPLCWQRGRLGALWCWKIFRRTTVCKQPPGPKSGWDNLKAKATALRRDLCRDLLLLSPDKAWLTTLKSPPFFGLNPLFRTSMQMLCVALG